MLGASTACGPGLVAEPMVMASVTATASHAALGASGASLTPLGPATMSVVGSVAMPPPAAQATGATNPFLL